ncbi:ATM interactor-like isoform X2 [Vulpes vulpes]|uniref:ATM interactor-like isoform X2 n=1 Tax=Vulpes vulpes TaxID=9627 RepID=A0ABM4ZF75_VULVU
MAASEAAAAGSAALASGAPTVPTAARGAAAAAAAAASGPWGPPGRLRGSRPRPAAARQQPAGPAPPARELIQPSVSELSRAVRTNILCTVRGCGKILPNSPALNMHLVKSHRLQAFPKGPVCQQDSSADVPSTLCKIYKEIYIRQSVGWRSMESKKTGGLMYTNYRELLYKTLPLCKYFEFSFTIVTEL